MPTNPATNERRRQATRDRFIEVTTRLIEAGQVPGLHAIGRAIRDTPGKRVGWEQIYHVFDGGIGGLYEACGYRLIPARMEKIENPT
jgi:hypothetical protein